MIKSATLRSPPSGKLYDEVHLEVALNPAACQAFRNNDNNYYWCVDLELDVAHTKQLRTICKIPTKLESMYQQIRVPGQAFLAATANITVETLCNVCTILVSLRNGDDHRLTSDNPLTIIMWVTQGPFGKTTSSKDGLLRSFYGIDAPDDDKKA